MRRERESRGEQRRGAKRVRLDRPRGKKVGG